ncbi:hypothetical protein [Serratia marcescens]|uniref:hypothetical protein n=1 Tax=Serratia TaxID=613 RepID=UPI000A4A1A8B|nr:hypothetical protein [Serratia marcescens]MBI6167307.1 hypothetical protein [Serratia marcescens]MCF1215364.1 hypothetical protein [Serratia marcescens]MCF1317888.1 hypothetical protein [Serratia marcescens]MCF1322642.1 hypothetical protein [Serratia marcescens]MDV5424525.1 hypothetical protein [Serratia marcescens]
MQNEPEVRTGHMKAGRANVLSQGATPRWRRLRTAHLTSNHLRPIEKMSDIFAK